MKKFFAFIFAVGVFLCIICCDSGEVNANNDLYGFCALEYVELPDYKSIDLPGRYHISDEELENYIYFELLNIGIYNQYELNDAMENSLIMRYFNDFIAKEYYGVESSEEARELLREKMMSEYIWYEVYEYIYSEAEVISYPAEKDTYILENLEKIRLKAKQQGLDFTEYLAEEYNITVDDYIENLTEGFREIMIVKALAENENITCSKQEYTDEIGRQQELQQTEEEEESFYWIYTSIYKNKLQDSIYESYYKEGSSYYFINMLIDVLACS